MLGKQRVRGQRPARGRARFDSHGLATQRRQDVPVRRIPRDRDGDTIAGIEGGQKGQNEAGRRTGRDHDARRIEVDAVPFVICQRDSPAQRFRTKRLCISEPRGAQRITRRGDGRRRCTCDRLADFHMDDPPPLRLETRRGRDHIHHHEWRHAAAFGRSQQMSSAPEHHIP